MWCVLALRKVDPHSSVAKKLYLSLNISELAPIIETLEIEALSCEEFIKLA